MVKKKDYTNGLPDPSQLKEEILAKYPRKVAKKRDKSMIINDPSLDQEIQANVRTIPGIITQRGCTYAGCKGVVLGPTRDIINLVHGPIGCSFYAWLTRRNQSRSLDSQENFIPYAFSTDMQDENIVFGGEIKLKEAIREAFDLFQPKAIGIFSTCPVGLIGDDVHAVARDMKAELGINIFGFSCEGYRGVSQSAGHHIANNQVMKNVVGRNNKERIGKFQVNLLGEYNIGGDAFEIEHLFEEAGITLISTFSGNSTIESMEYAHTADLNMVMCHRSINYIAEMMEEKYGIPWIKVNFVGAKSAAKSLKKIAEYFGDAELTAKVDEIVAREMAKAEAVRLAVKSKVEGKVAMMFVGGSRAHHYQDLFEELGIHVVSAGYEFAHRDDYEGRKVIPDIKIDADTRNIEELVVEKDDANFRDDLVAKKAGLVDAGYEFSDYEGMMPQMKKNALVIDDVNHWETEKLIEFYHPDVFCAGIKEKYVVQKYGVPLKQLHNYDAGGPYTCFDGAVNFYKEMQRMLDTKIWKLVDTPWKNEPEIVGSMTIEA